MAVEQEVGQERREGAHGASFARADAAGAAPVRVGFVLHVMQVAGAEMLCYELIQRLGAAIVPAVYCLDGVGALGERLLAQGVPVIALGRRPGLDYALPGRFAAALREHGTEVLHAHQYTPFFYAALAARLVRPRPRIILTEHGRHFPDIVSGKRRLVNRWLLQRDAQRVTAVCRFSADALATLDGFDAKPVEVIENGIDPEKYAPRGSRDERVARVGLDPARRYVACVARFHPVKDHDMLLRGFAPAAAELPDVDLLLVGDGPLRPQLTALAESLGISARVRFLGVRSDVADLLQAADVFALTSISEAASITLLEAMAAEKPVVVTAVGGNPEIVRDGVDGWLVPRGDAAALSRRLIDLLRDPSKAAAAGAHGAARVRETFTMSAVVRRYLELYRSLGRSPGRS